MKNQQFEIPRLYYGNMKRWEFSEYISSENIDSYFKGFEMWKNVASCFDSNGAIQSVQQS